LFKHGVSLCSATIARISDKTDTKKILTASPWRTGGDHQDALVYYVDEHYPARPEIQ